MCGICGIIRFDGTVPEEPRIREMMRLQKHRGPDDEGIFIEDNIGLGFVRLSILDLSPAGHQPMFSHDERYVIVFNGEIFNYIELRYELKAAGYTFHTNTDTEVLLAAWQEWGESCLDRFNGMWAFVIYDRQEKKIFASRDRYGIKPLYYLASDPSFAFSSEIPPLLSLLPGKPTQNEQAIFDYLVFNRTDHSDKTFFREIRKLQHGHCITIDLDSNNASAKIQIKEWYNLRKKVSGSEGFKSPAEFRELFNSAIQLRLRSDVPVGVCLSGGLDSSSIVSVLVKDLGKKDLNTFSAVYGKGQSGDESEFIRLFDSEVSSMHYISPSASGLMEELDLFIRAQCEPIPTTSPYAQFKVMQLAKNKVVVTLDGQGADEQLAGYHYFYGFYFKDLLKRFNLVRLFSEMTHYIRLHRSITGLKTFVYFLLPEKMRIHASIGDRDYLHPVFISSFKQESGVAGQLYGSSSLKDALINHFEYKLEHLLKWEDRNSMWYSLEARVPFLDYRLVEKVLATPDKMIIRKGMTKHILRKAMSGTVPDKILYRRDKMGFSTPQDEWFKTPEWEKLIRDILKSGSFKNRKIILPEKAIAQYEKHLSGKVNNSKEIWKWINLELWFRKYIDKSQTFYD